MAVENLSLWGSEHMKKSGSNRPSKEWRELSVLITGCGTAGRRHARVLDGLGVRDIRACDPSEAQRQSLQEQVARATFFESYEAGLNEQPDSVLICTLPTHTYP